MDTRSPVASLVRRYSWLAYWLIFAAYAVDAARDPGLVVPNRENGTYPWTAALVTCGLLGVQTAALNSVLRPLSESRSWRRVAAASGLALLFGALNGITMFTDMPGYYYAPRRDY